MQKKSSAVLQQSCFGWSPRQSIATVVHPPPKQAPSSQWKSRLSGQSKLSLHGMPQNPSPQTSPLAQTIPQSPQFAGSNNGSTQTSLQGILLGQHEKQYPSSQISPARHLLVKRHLRRRSARGGRSGRSRAATSLLVPIET